MPVALRGLLGALAATLLALCTVTPAHSSAKSPRSRDTYEHYVALGDSYTSGPGIPDSDATSTASSSADEGVPFGCGQSTRNYPHRVAAALQPSTFTDASCGGATTADLRAPQHLPDGEVHEPQFDALRANTDLVTLGIGGNDIDFAGIVGTCALLAPTDIAGAPCQRHFTRSGTDELADRIDALAPKITAAVRGIHERSPHARVVLVNYLRILPTIAGCFPLVPAARGDVAYLNATEITLNRTITEAARAAGATAVDTFTPSLGHDACRAPHTRWVEPAMPVNGVAPIHPNARGMAATARLVENTLADNPARSHTVLSTRSDESRSGENGTETARSSSDGR